MTELLLSLDSKLSKDYFLLVVDTKWIERIRSARKASRLLISRRRSKQIALIMKGNEILYAHDHVESALVRRLEYSNTLLLAISQFSGSDLDTNNHLISSKTVLGMFNIMYQLQGAPPILNALSLLRANYLTSAELSTHCEAPEGDTYSFSELCVLGNCSPEQLSNALEEKGALVYQNKIRLLHPKEIFSALHCITRTADQQRAVSFSAIYEDIMKALPSMSTVVINAVRYFYEENQRENGDSLYITHLKPVATLKALTGHVFLNTAMSKEENVQGIKVYGIDTSVFVSLWVKDGPEVLFRACGVSTKSPDEHEILGLLDGVVITNDTTHMTWWIPEDYLPYEIERRIDILFEINPYKWTEKALKAYVQPLMGQVQSFSHYIQRYSREYRLPGQPVMYSKLSQNS